MSRNLHHGKVDATPHRHYHHNYKIPIQKASTPNTHRHHHQQEAKSKGHQYPKGDHQFEFVKTEQTHAHHRKRGRFPPDDFVETITRKHHHKAVKHDEMGEAKEQPELENTSRRDEMVEGDQDSRAFIKIPHFILALGKKKGTQAPANTRAYGLPGGGQSHSEVIDHQKVADNQHSHAPSSATPHSPPTPHPPSPPPPRPPSPPTTVKPATATSQPPPEIIKVTGTCGNIRGYFGVANDCLIYGYCLKPGAPKKQMKCVDGETFDHIKRKCMIGGACDKRMVCPDDNKRYGGLPSEGKRAYLKCTGGVPLPQFCPEGEIYQASTSSCVKE